MVERETVVVDRGTSPMAIVAGILFVVAILVVAYLVFFNGNGGDGAATLDVDVPAVSVEVAPDGQ